MLKYLYPAFINFLFCFLSVYECILMPNILRGIESNKGDPGDRETKWLILALDKEK
jgi:hypothetical protein